MKPLPDAAPESAVLRPMQSDTLEAVLAIEQSVYSHPWSRGNFRDALASGYWAQCLFLDDALLGYLVAMQGYEETHLLNLTVAPERQRQGWGVMMLDALSLWSRHHRARLLWLEVRESNRRALEVYERYGFVRAGLRKDYYPVDRLRREHAVVMTLRLMPPP